MIEPCPAFLVRERRTEGKHILQIVQGDVLLEDREGLDRWFEGNHSACLTNEPASHHRVNAKIGPHVNENSSWRKDALYVSQLGFIILTEGKYKFSETVPLGRKEHL